MLNMTEYDWMILNVRLFQSFSSLKTFHLFISFPPLISAAFASIFAFASIEFYQFRLRSPRLRWQPQHFCCLLLKLLLGRCHTRQRLSNLASQNNQFLHSAFVLLQFFSSEFGRLKLFPFAFNSKRPALRESLFRFTWRQSSSNRWWILQAAFLLQELRPGYPRSRRVRSYFIAARQLNWQSVCWQKNPFVLTRYSYFV